MSINIFWFRRDLRLNDNAGLYHVLKSANPVLPIFIFDTNILNKLEDRDDARVTFIHDAITELKMQLDTFGSTLAVFYGDPLTVFKELSEKYTLDTVFTNRDYEAYALTRDNTLKTFFKSQNIDFQHFKDHVIFDYKEVVKDDGSPYTVFTPYSKKWKMALESQMENYNGQNISFYLKPYPSETYFSNFIKLNELETQTKPPILITHNSKLITHLSIPSLESMNFIRSSIPIPSKTVARSVIKTYDTTRNYPALPQSTSKLGIHFRFGTISIREKALAAQSLNETYLNELIWRDFYAMILQHFPHISAGKAFRPEYDRIEWRNNETEFDAWCEGKTGYPLVDAGMHELNATGYMHNRVRMVVSSFLTKHLLIDWRWGEAYFAKKLLDFDFSSNNGGWQWAAGSGTDAAPYFRIFNPTEQQKKFDADFKYIKHWVKEFDTPQYKQPIVDHKMARERCLKTYSAALKKA